MNQFIVKVLCAAHLTTCPIPNGYKSALPAKDKTECEHRAKTVIAAYGYKSKDFTVSCEKK